MQNCKYTVLTFIRLHVYFMCHVSYKGVARRLWCKAAACMCVVCQKKVDTMNLMIRFIYITLTETL